ncbi:MAG: NAD(P)/FAD-dependent oxidoreductase, partial [Chloroflexota bacterium]
MPEFEAIVVGSGPNGLAAAVTLAGMGARVLVLEAKDTIGGGTRTAELTLPGFRHDICSTAHPLGVASPFFRNLDLAGYGLEWIQPDFPLVHPLDDGAVVMDRSVDKTAAGLGADAGAYRRLMDPLVDGWPTLLDTFLGPLRLPHRPLPLLRFALAGLLPAKMLAERRFSGEPARALLAGSAAHITLPLEWRTTAAYGLVLAMLGHAVGWPVAKGGSQAIADALGAYLQARGSVIETRVEVRSLAELPPARAVLLDVGPRQVLKIAGERLPDGYRRALERFRYGQGAFKIDYALSEPIPWTADVARRAGTLHLGGTMAEIARAEREIWSGVHPDHPYVLLNQASLFDPTRAPAGRHTAWAYCHVPNGSNVDMTARIENQIERFAPGFRDCVLARHTITAGEFEVYNPNYVGGDINGGAQDWRQLYTRPVARLDPYATPLPDLFLCSSATPPGGGVHGMCGY